MVYFSVFFLNVGMSFSTSVVNCRPCWVYFCFLLFTVFYFLFFHYCGHIASWISGAYLPPQDNLKVSYKTGKSRFLLQLFFCRFFAKFETRINQACCREFHVKFGFSSTRQIPSFIHGNSIIKRVILTLTNPDIFIRITSINYIQKKQFKEIPNQL